MNTYRWSDRAKQDDDEAFSEDDRSLDVLGNSILRKLRQAGKHSVMTLEELSRCIGYDIEGNQELMDALQRNPLIEFDYPELRYKPPINADSEQELLDDLKDRPDGVYKSLVEAANINSEYMIDSLVRSGEVIGARDEKSNSVSSIFPRRYRFFSRLSGTATVEKNSSCIIMTENVSGEIRQGDAVGIREIYKSVDSSPKKFPLSVSSTRSLDESIDKREAGREWTHKITDRFYIDSKYQGNSESGVPVYKFGLTNDLRALWLENCNRNFLDRRTEELEKEIQETEFHMDKLFTMETKQVKRERSTE